MKRLFYKITSIIGGLLTAGPVFAGNYIDISAENLASTTDIILKMFDDVGPLIWLYVGVGLAFYIMGRIISFFIMRRWPID